MTVAELQKAIKKLRKDGYTDVEMLDVFYAMYKDDVISIKELRYVTETLGYEFTEKFDESSEKDKKKKGFKYQKIESREGMSFEELQGALDQLRRQGYTEDDMLKVFYLMYSDGKINLDSLRTITETLGYEFTEDFENMSYDDKKTKGLTSIEPENEKIKKPKKQAGKKSRKSKDKSLQEAEGMTIDEIKEMIEGFKKEGYTEEDILKIFYTMYADDSIPLEDLRILIEAMGYEFTDEFEAMSEEDKKTKGLTDKDESAEGVDEEEVERLEKLNTKKNKPSFLL